MRSLGVKWLLMLILLELLAWAAASGETQSVPAALGPVNAGFEIPGLAGLPFGWSLLPGQLPAGGRIGASAESPHSGRACLMIDNNISGSVSIVSEPVKLTVGHLYRLSGWVRTKGAITDPVARYPTALPACLSMGSFPFTESSPAVGATSEWRQVSTLFFAIRGTDHVQLHLGRNGGCAGSAWFDDVRLEEVSDIQEFIPLETVRWSGAGFRYDDHGWIFVHIEGDPYPRGRQFGALVADEIAQYIRKLAVNKNDKNPTQGWGEIRLLADALFLRKFDQEYLEEMRGIADGAAKAGAKFNDRPLDLLDIVAVNSAVDIGQLSGALGVTAHGLSGRNFFKAEDEIGIPDDHNKCSSLVASRSATPDGRFVFGQLFMWNGYTGSHWNIFCDVVPAKGHRLLYQTFPGGIHSASDFYLNSAGICIGETTVGQTSFNAEGTPQSNRIRKAAQYATSIDEVVKILVENNNGLYTNDWTIADNKTNEVAVLLLGTRKWKLWRTGTDTIPADTPGALKDFIWANNNNRDLEVRKEYIPHPENAPYDLAFNPWNRDLAFVEFYRQFGQGKIDSNALVQLWASSPMNRPHACDGKVCTGEMADQLMVLAHYGKTTLREKVVGSRFIPDLPEAVPHLSLGYTAFSPVFVTEKLKALRPNASPKAGGDDKGLLDKKKNLDGVDGFFTYPRPLLWANTVYPAADADNWFTSGTAAYWRLLRELPDKPDKALETLRNYMADLNCRYLYVAAHEGDTAPLTATTVYDRYGNYQIPRIKGIVLLHQLRLLLGNQVFGQVMDTVHHRYANQPMTTADFIRVAGETAKTDLAPFIRQWLERTGLPELEFTATLNKVESGNTVELEIRQKGEPYHLVFGVEIDTDKTAYFQRVEIREAVEKVTLRVPEAPVKLVFNPTADFPTPTDNFYTLVNFTDDFANSVIIYGTARQIEAGRTLATNWSTVLGDAFSEYLTPVRKDCEVTPEELAGKDLFVLGALADNEIIRKLDAEKRLPVEIGKNIFRWKGRSYTRPEDGLILVLPNPYNSKRVLYLFLANSALELYRITHAYQRGIPSWAVFSGDEVVARGYHLLGLGREVVFPPADK